MEGIRQFFRQNLEEQHIRAQITTNFLTIVAIAILYGIYLLAGEYLDTFIFMFISAISLKSLKSMIINQLKELLNENKNQGLNPLYALFSFRFSIIPRICRFIIQNLKSFTKLKNTIMDFIVLLSSSKYIPYAFFLYILIYKKRWHFYILICDLSLWIFVDMCRGVLWLFYNLRCAVRIIERTQPMTQRERIRKMVKDWNESVVFNQFLFCGFILLLLFTIPLSISLIYQDIITYKTDLVPLINKIDTKFNINEYFKPEYMLTKLEGNYLSQETIQQFQQDKLCNKMKLKMIKFQNKFMEMMLNTQNPYSINVKVPISANYKFIQQIIDTQTKKQLQNNQSYQQFHQYVETIEQYFQQIYPQIQDLISVVFKSFFSIFSSSMILIFKFMIYREGVLILLEQNTVKVSDLIFFDGIGNFKHQVSKKINEHITGVFIALFLIFIYHFMLTYILLDYAKIQLAFILSLLAGIFSLTQIVSPAMFYMIITLIWSYARSFQENDFPYFNLISILIYFISSGSIYQTCFSVHIGHPFWIGISVILGYTSFDLKGIVYGPLLIGFIRVLTDLIYQYFQQDGFLPESQKQLEVKKYTKQIEQNKTENEDADNQEDNEKLNQSAQSSEIKKKQKGKGKLKKE